MILFADDEPRRMTAYVAELEDRGYKVDVHKDADTAWTAFEKNSAEYDLVVLDVMMPVPLSFKRDNTEGGLRTGLRLYERIRKIAPDIPVAVFTHVADELVLELFAADPCCRHFRKSEYLPYEFADEIAKLRPK